MRVLLIEDHVQLAGLVGRELQQEFGCSVTHARDPVEARALYRAGAFDLAVIDLLYEHLNRDFEARRAAGEASLTQPGLLVTGLAAVHQLTVPRRDVGVVIWTAGEANRRLHLLFAYEDLAVRVFCSKSSGTGRVDTLMDALKAAADGRTYIDPVLNSYLPADGAPAISATILHDQSKRSIWRALALGARTRGQISAITGYSTRTVGNLIPAMFDDLAALDTGLGRGDAPMAEVVSYASRNWEFFLDDTVRTMYP
jgi:DNA-binding NarL/FixJ family response regulator